ncbi:MAG: hypothetical protein QE271_11580 [Bacteriovoracaceae bacterium]|nr:hypothetical protein [Bacteriovoracaceae bacterium]
MKFFSLFLVLFNFSIAEAVPPHEVFSCPALPTSGLLTSDGDLLHNNNNSLMPFSGNPAAQADTWVASLSSGNISIKPHSAIKFNDNFYRIGCRVTTSAGAAFFTIKKLSTKFSSCKIFGNKFTCYY